MPTLPLPLIFSVILVHSSLLLLAQAAESQLADLKQAAAEAVSELAEERKRGVVKERKLMDRTHEASKLREQLHEAENAHQVNARTGLMSASVCHDHKTAIQPFVCLVFAFYLPVIGHVEHGLWHVLGYSRYALTAKGDLSYLLFAWSWGNGMKPAHFLPSMSKSSSGCTHA